MANIPAKRLSLAGPSRRGARLRGGSAAALVVFGAIRDQGLDVVVGVHVAIHVEIKAFWIDGRKKWTVANGPGWRECVFCLGDLNLRLSFSRGNLCFLF